ncbi:hypothetical protein ACFHYQ_03010 [Sphaerimonospora cavernae]|uniref:Uncharacterized protein n=1 Tax=Sphaerimonospora cavernae TaxID=1740611 RepID=A0ABV6U285_9ACTN
MTVAELTPPPDGTPRPHTGGLPAAGVTVTGLAMAVTALLPWAGVTAKTALLDAELTHSVRGVDYGAGWFVMGAGIAAMLLGLLGLRRDRLYAGFAILPGAVAAFALAMFLTDPRELADRLDFRIPGLLDVHPAIQYGWFAALLTSIVVAALAATAFLRQS